MAKLVNDGLFAASEKIGGQLRRGRPIPVIPGVLAGGNETLALYDRHCFTLRAARRRHCVDAVSHVRDGRLRIRMNCDRFLCI